MQKYATPVIIGIAIIISTCIYVYFSPYHSCMRALGGSVPLPHLCIGK
ncbi:UDP-N-acetylmuramyl pentapeptide phosphotransferase/UDP-N-acetylglucosamine-1-phosphate transferase [Sinorhizobium fredii]